MRERNWRLIIVGVVLCGGAGGFFLYMQTLAPMSNDPVTMMRTAGQAAGAVGGTGLVMLALGLIGRTR